MCIRDRVKRYLYEYGYLYTKDKTSLQLVNDSDVSNALLIFQEYYKLPADGKLNNETRNLMLNVGVVIPIFFLIIERNQLEKPRFVVLAFQTARKMYCQHALMNSITVT